MSQCQFWSEEEMFVQGAVSDSLCSNIGFGWSPHCTAAVRGVCRFARTTARYAAL